MGYCQQDDCARVMYQEYLPAVVRWQYPGEAWQEITGDDYLVRKLKGQDCSITYTVKYKIRRQYCYLPAGGDESIRVVGITGKILSGQVGNNPDYPGSTVWQINYQPCNQPVTYYPLYGERVGIVYGGCATYDPYDPNTGKYDGDNCSVEILDITPGDTSCVLTIFKNGQTVYTETRTVCPEVEKLPALLSQTPKQIEVKKDLDLETIEINQINIPDSCWNIYLKSGDTSQFVNQICSATGNLPPVYQVICGCDRLESCPPNTCAVQCGDKVCCYGAGGVSVKSIDLSSYG